MTYEYLVIATGETVTVEQRITEPAHTVLEIDGELRAVKRLISAESGGFRLVSGPSGGWSSTGYAPTIQQRKAEAKLGRKCIPRAE